MHAHHTRFVVKIRNGKPEALNEIYQNYFNEMVRWMISKGLPEEEAKDKFQDAIRKFIEKCADPEFTLTSSLKSYLYGICKNLIREYFRSSGKSSVRITEALHILEEEKDLLLLAEELERSSQWHKLLGRTFILLDSRCQQIFNMIVEKVPAKDIAKQLGMSGANAVYAARFRCRGAWSRLIEADNDFPKYKPEGW